MSQVRKLPPRPLLQDGSEGWRAYWEALGQLWRREPEIPLYRQRVLAGRRSRVPHEPMLGLRAVYPFSRFRLTRADVEWLLATHEGGRGPISSTDEGWEGRRGLDLRGADLQMVDLSGLPMANLIGGYEGKNVTAGQWPSLSQHVIEGAAIHLEGANLSRAWLDGASLAGAHLEGANLYLASLWFADLRSAHLVASNLVGASLVSATLWYAQVSGVDLKGAFLQCSACLAAQWRGADLRLSHMEGADLSFSCFTGCLFQQSYLEGADLTGSRFIGVGSVFRESHLEGATLGNVRLIGVSLKGAFLSGATITGLLSWLPEPLQGAHTEEKEVGEADLSRIRAWVPEFPALLSAINKGDAGTITTLAGEGGAEARTGSGDDGNAQPQPQDEYARLVALGRDALFGGEPTPWTAHKHLLEAIRVDPLDPAHARWLSALASLTNHQLEEATSMLEYDLALREPAHSASLLLYAWCCMGQCVTIAAYLERERELLALPAQDTPLDTLLSMGEQLEPTEETALFLALMGYLGGDVRGSLDALERLKTTWQGEYPWMLSFWESMAYASLEEDERALASLDTAIDQGIPPLLLLPLRWFKQTRPYFFDEFIRPLFLDYRLPGRDTWGQRERKKGSKARTKREVEQA